MPTDGISAAGRGTETSVRRRFLGSPRTWGAERKAQGVAADRLQEFFMPSGHELRMTAYGTTRTFKDVRSMSAVEGQAVRPALPRDPPPGPVRRHARCPDLTKTKVRQMGSCGDVVMS